MTIEQTFDFRRRDRLAEKVALNLRAAFAPQFIKLRFSLHSFGRGGHTERNAKPHHGAVDFDLFRLFGQIND
jgi:hypothetical protein